MSGRVWVFADDVDTDALAPGLYMKHPLDELAGHCLESLDAGFARAVRAGDVIAAGRNFGMGSSREQAAQALVHLGVAAVIARSFAGIFYRNAFNNGLLAIVCPGAAGLAAGEPAAVDAIAGTVTQRGRTIACEPVPEHLRALVHHGGLVPYLEHRLRTERARG